MLSRALVLFSALGPCGLATAQSRSAQPPIKVTPPQPYPPLGPSAVSSAGCVVSQVGQIELRPIAGQPPNVFHCTLSVKVNGGTTWDLVTGTFDCDAPSFTKNNDVAHLNTTVADEFAGSVSRDLLVFVYDAGGSTMFCTRASTGVAFGAPQVVTGVPGGSIDPKLGYDGAQEKLAYRDPVTGDIVWADFNRVTGATTGAFVLVQATSVVEGFHSPEPMRDPTGTARAFLLGKLDPANLSDAWYASGKFNLPPVVAHPLHETGPSPATYLRNGTALGGTAFVPEGPAYGDPLRIDFEATNCDVADDGSTVVLCNFFPYKPVAPFDVAVALGALARQPLPIPGVRGLLGLDPLQPIVFLPFLPAPPYTGVVCWNLPVPIGTPAAQLASQAILFNRNQATVYLGNNSSVWIR
ncbi:MAG: hypothetical protein R3F56_07445 [Planctomycetota bacterium]